MRQSGQSRTERRRFDVLSRDQYGTAYDLRMKRREWLRRQRERERFAVFIGGLALGILLGIAIAL